MPRGITIRSPSREKAAQPPPSPVTEAEETKKEKILGPYDDTLFAPVYFPPPRSVLVDLLVQGLCVKVSHACCALLSRRLCFIGSGFVVIYWVTACSVLAHGLLCMKSWFLGVYWAFASCGLLHQGLYIKSGFVVVEWVRACCVASQGLLQCAGFRTVV